MNATSTEPCLYETVDAEIFPEGSLEVLSHVEVEQLRSSGAGGLYPLLRRCMLAVLNSGSDTDDAQTVLTRYRHFDVAFLQQDRGLKLSVTGCARACIRRRADDPRHTRAPVLGRAGHRLHPQRNPR